MSDILSSLFSFFITTILFLTAVSPMCIAAISENLLRNPSFSEGTNEDGIPVGWSIYGGKGESRRISLVDMNGSGQKAAFIEDDHANAEIGLTQTISVEPGLTYQTSVDVRTVKGASSHGAYIQLRFHPSEKYAQESLGTFDSDTPKRISVKATAPPDTESATVYLYTHRDPTPKMVLSKAELVSGVEPPPPPPPEPVPPAYTKLKDLHIRTEIVRSGKPNITIISPASGVYAEQARRIQRGIRELTGVEVPIASDESDAGAVPINGNLIAIGNRSTNKTIGELYNRYYTLLDLRYPGPEGYVVRTLHNPFGDGRNVIFAGGSDAAGVDAAADALIAELKKADSSGGSLSVGRLAEIRLGKGITVPEDIRDFEIWDASKGYRSVGYFGWNSISKRMAMYYMTGDEFHAREFIRLAFPDEKARQEISDIDGERLENKDEPLSGPYHYNAHLMIVYWDLIEESPVFSDEERLRVTNAFSKQLNHRKGEGVYGRTETPSAVGSRHGQWSAISLYCLGRYFEKDYANPIWQHCVESSQLHFKPLYKYAWVSGESDNLFWYNTGIAPIFTYMLLTGDRKPIESGSVQTLLRGQEMLISGREPDWALNSASVGYLHKAAYLMQDGRYVLYRQRTGVDVDIFRLGQSYWPEDHLIPTPPDDLVGKWSINYLPEPSWASRNNGFKLEESFSFGSFRSASDASGDFILIDGYNGASRNPYHTFALLELRLGGYTLLRGYLNQLLTRADGLVEAHIAMDAALRYDSVLGETATVVGEVPDAAYCVWRRTLAQRIGKYAIVVDTLTPRVNADNMEVQIKWETEGRPEDFADGHIEFSAPIEKPERGTKTGGQIWISRPTKTTHSGRISTMEWTGPVKENIPITFFSLVGVQPDAEKDTMNCVSVADNAAGLALPLPALAVTGEFGGVSAELGVLACDHLYGKGLLESEKLIVADKPVDVDWDFASGVLHLNTAEATSLQMTLESPDKVKLDGKAAGFSSDKEGLVHIDLSTGKHIFEGAMPKSSVLVELRRHLMRTFVQGMAKHAMAMAAQMSRPKPEAPPLETAMVANVGGEIVDLIAVPSETGGLIYAAEGKTVHIFSPDGKEVRTLKADGAIRMLRMWKEHNLLLAGCADEQVIAFDENGERRWVFTSEMDPAVFRAAKTYWFKTAPGHEGIHGLYTAVFLDGKSQAFVGSACTLEILDENGKLIRRMPQFWGKVSHFNMIDGPDGSLNLLASRKYNGTNTVAIINNKTLNSGARGFNSVPSGATYVPGWSSMNRNHLFYDDLDGDGKKEVMSEINGTWNRVTVWTAEGQPLYDASFGPGERIMAKNMRDIDIADLNGDGKKEIVVGTSAGMIVALDYQCKKIWAVRLESPPTVIRCMTPEGGTRPWIVIGCEDGSVVVLNGSGKTIRLDRVTGTPTCIDKIITPTASPMVLIATDKGEVKGFNLEE